MITLQHLDRAGRRLASKVNRPKVWRGEEDTIVLVETLREGVISDTAAGVDANGRQFAPYSAKYAKKTGKTQVDLSDSGVMLSTLIVEALNTRGSVIAPTTRAAVHNFGSRARGIPARPYMGIASDTAAEAAQEADQHVASNIAASFTSKTALRALSGPRGSTRGAL